MKKFKKELLAEFIKTAFYFALSGGVYYLIELIWKQHSDTSMFLIGGIIGTMCYMINNIFTYNFDFLAQVSICTIITTIFEGVVGNIVNTDFSIWDYRKMPFGNFWNDQCNVIFVGVWFFLIAIFIPLYDYVDYKLFDYLPDTPPYYMIFGKKVIQFKKRCHCECHKD